MRCAGAILLIAIFICFSNEVRSSNKFKELSKGNWNKLHGSKKTNCKYIKCPTKVDRACVRVKNKKGYATKTIYISVVNKCEIDYIRCHEDLEATLVPLEKCLHKMSADNRKLKKEANTTKKRLKRSPHIVTKTGNNRLAKQSRKLSSQFNKSPFHNKYSSLYFGPKRKAVYIEINTDNKNDDNENENENDNGHDNHHDNDRDNDHDNDHDGNHDNDRDNDHDGNHDNDHSNDNDHDNDHGNDHDNDRGNDHDNDHGNDHDNDRDNDHNNDHGNDHDNDRDNDNENEEENFNDNVESDRNDDREIKEYGDEHGDRELMDGGEIEKEAQDTNTETEESLVGKEKDDKEIDDKELILFDVNSAKDNVYSKLAMDKDSQIEGHKSNEDENVNDENFNKKENVPKDTKETEANDEQTLDNHNNMEDFNEDKLNDEEGHKPVNEDQTLIITFDRKDKVDESEAENVETENLNDKTEVDNETDDNGDRESQQGYVEEKVDSDRQTFNIHTETQKHADDNVKSKNDSNENEGSNDTLNAENQESEKGIETKQKETILININYKPKKTDDNVSKATNNNAKNEKKNVEKEKTKTEKKVIDSDTSTEEDKKDVKTNDANKPHDGKKAEKQTEDNYDDVGKDPYNNDCPTVCPARDVMLCARCKEGVYRTFMSACHLRMFNCKHPEEKLELISRKPCILSAPFLNGLKTKGAVKESGNEDKVLRYIRCREKGDPNDPSCNFGRRARKRRING